MTAAAVRPAPGAARLSALARVPAFWVVAARLLAGAIRMAQLAGRLASAYPIATVVEVAMAELSSQPGTPPSLDNCWKRVRATIATPKVAINSRARPAVIWKP